MFYGNYDSDGNYIGFYTKDIHGENIPTPNIELSEREWQEALTDNYKVINGRHTYCEPVPLDIEQIKQQKLTVLDAEYQSQFAELSEAFGIATLGDNIDLIANIKTDYVELKAEYDTKRGEINV